MKYYRYGKFRPSDYLASWMGMALLLIFAIASIVLDLSLWFVVFPMVYSAIWLWTIITPNREQFTICDNTITVLKGKHIQKIIIPSEVTLVVSCVDISPPFATHTVFGSQTHILQEKYAISILRKMPLDIVLDNLHRNHVWKYTTSMIQMNVDDYNYVYSFVCDQSLIEKLITNRDCQIIIPESLLTQISIDRFHTNVHVDIGY